MKEWNDNADKLAKKFMAKAEEMKAAPYFTAYEEESFMRTHL